MEIGFAQTNIELLHQLETAAGWPVSQVVDVAKCYRVAFDLMAAAFRPSGKHFVDHLVGTASILGWSKQPVRVVNAGLLHSVYKYGDFGLTSDVRSVVRGRVGAQVEDLVYRYHTNPWSAQIVRELASGKRPIGSVDRAILIIRLANHLEDHLDHGLMYYPGAGTREGRRPALGDELIQLANAIGDNDLAEAMNVAFEADARVSIPEVLRSVDHSINFERPLYAMLHPVVAIRTAPTTAVSLIRTGVKNVLRLAGMR